jgi:hypothetical protein
MAGRNELDPYTRLANEIILQAVKDYREANKKLAHGKVNHTAEALRNDALRFFHSAWFGELTEIDSEMLIRKLDEEVTA